MVYHSYDEYIKEIVKETFMIYGPDTINRIGDFRSFFEDATLMAAMKGQRILFSSAGNTPTSNIRQALIASGINKSGELPIGRCYGTQMLEDDNIHDLAEGKLNDKMQVLVDKIRGEGGEYGINRYLAENPKSDPNAFEMVDVLSTYQNLVALGKTPPEDVKKSLDNMFSKRKQNFIENGIGTDSAAYRICEFCHDPENLEEYPLPATTIAAMRKIASLDLYSRQQIRDNQPPFDNVAEVESAKDYFKASDELKPGFLDAFKGDLENIYDTARANKEKNNQKEYE